MVHLSPTLWGSLGRLLILGHMVIAKDAALLRLRFPKKGEELFIKRRKKNLVRNGEWEKETCCSTKLKTLYLLKKMVAIRRLWCSIAGQGNLGFFACHCTECARCGPGRCNQHGAVEEWCLCAPSRDCPAEAPCQDCRGNCSCGPWLIPEKAEGFIRFWSFPP